MKRVPIQVDPKFKEMLDRMRHEFCIKEKKEVSLREFSKILYEKNAFEEEKQTKEEKEKALGNLMRRLR
ncbi:MAG: hypothetical protein Q8P15_02695 [Nanoarchaeota archaeon]|nr:hypothetical protein [Nanoarchaeota archaeon]